MKIAVATRYPYRVGGVESYLESVLPVLAARGHAVSLWYEVPSPAGTEPFVPPSVPAHLISAADLERLSPDVIFLNGLSDVGLETRLGGIAPTVILLHAYHGTCISGSKTYSYPVAQPCSRTLGPGCLVRYYPRRCGGWSPLTMVRRYGEQRRRQQLLRTSPLVTTLSEHMRQECITHGVDASRVIRLPAFAPGSCASGRSRGARPAEAPFHLLFAGRMETLKGGQVLLDALAVLQSRVQAPVRVTFAGDGPERASWERQAAAISNRTLDIRFVGWLSPSERSDLFGSVDLLAVPSVWPEPLGLIGLEAAAAGIPAVAFDVGGIREWLTDGVTGRLVPIVPVASRAAALARAVEECLRAPDVLRTWSAAALVSSRDHTLDAHVQQLEETLASVHRVPVHA